MRPALRPAIFALLIGCLASCGLFVSFDDFDTSSTGPGGGSDSGFVVGGIVSGLGGASATLTLNSGTPLPVSDGPFVFPERLLDGAGYLVTIATSEGFTCRLTADRGTIRAANVDDVRMTCLSKGVVLTSLTVSVGALTPTFESVQTEYAAGPVRVPVVPGAGAMVAVTATSLQPDARIALAGTAPSVGKLDAKTTIALGQTSVTVDVTAPDGNTHGRYVVRVTGKGESDYLKGASPYANQVFGAAVAADGDTIAVGALGDASNATTVNGDPADRSAPMAGAVFVFRRAAGVWKREAYLKATNAKAGAQFGSAVALSGDTLVVGATSEGTPSAGAVYVFVRSGTTWTQQAYLKAAVPQIDASLGHAVALAGDTLLASALNENDGAKAMAGAIHVFTRAGTTWTEEVVLRAPGSTPGLQFGNSVALAGSTLAAGSTQAAGPQGQSSVGAVWTFSRSTGAWLPEATITPLIPQTQMHFGASVGLSADTLAVGAPDESSDGTDEANSASPSAGAVFVFAHAASAWKRTTWLKGTKPRAQARFGTRVGLVGNALAASGDEESSKATGLNGDELDTSAPIAGAAWIFERTAASPPVWTRRAYLKASNTRAASYFGASIALTKDLVVLGAPGESGGNTTNQSDTSQTNAGAVYAF